MAIELDGEVIFNGGTTSSDELLRLPNLNTDWNAFYFLILISFIFLLFTLCSYSYDLIPLQSYVWLRFADWDASCLLRSWSWLFFFILMIWCCNNLCRSWLFFHEYCSSIVQGSIGLLWFNWKIAFSFNFFDFFLCHANSAMMAQFVGKKLQAWIWFWGQGT